MNEIRTILLWTTALIAFVILISSIWLAGNLLFLDTPKPPILSSSANTTEQDAKAKEIANYKDLISTLQTQRTNVFDFVVIKALLPLFTSLITAVITYIFAKAAYTYFLGRSKAKIDK